MLPQYYINHLGMQDAGKFIAFQLKIITSTVAALLLAWHHLAYAGQLIFVSSYFDYVRLRGFLKEQEEHFEALTEYASGSEVARGRHRFATGKTRLAIYTERSHFYHRRRSKGIRVRSALCFAVI